MKVKRKTKKAKPTKSRRPRSGGAKRARDKMGMTLVIGLDLKELRMTKGEPVQDGPIQIRVRDTETINCIGTPASFVRTFGTDDIAVIREMLDTLLSSTILHTFGGPSAVRMILTKLYEMGASSDRQGWANLVGTLYFMGERASMRGVPDSVKQAVSDQALRARRALLNAVART
jgi:hypothetical protein